MQPYSLCFRQEGVCERLVVIDGVTAFGLNEVEHFFGSRQVHLAVAAPNLPDYLVGALIRFGWHLGKLLAHDFLAAGRIEQDLLRLREYSGYLSGEFWPVLQGVGMCRYCHEHQIAKFLEASVHEVDQGVAVFLLLYHDASWLKRHRGIDQLALE